MSDTLSTLKKELEKLISQVGSSIPNDEPFGNAHNNWSFPGLTRVELMEDAQSVLDSITDHDEANLGEAESRLQDYIRRLQHLRQTTVGNIWGNANQGVAAYVLTLNGLRNALKPILKSDDGSDASKALRQLKTRITSMEARLRDLEPRTGSLGEMVDQIENAYDAADRLPETMESLAEYRQKISDIERAVSKDHAHIETLRETAEANEKNLISLKENAEGILARCETAYSAATSVGLAAAFSERSDSLSGSIKYWVGGLLIALVAACGLGIYRIVELSDIIKTAPPVTVALNVLISVFAVGAPVWFAWLATKQIGQRFRLAEDYAFKASVSRAYEGYSREAARVDKELEARLLASALNRLDELPLRVVETHSHGSPLHELASSKIVLQAIKTIPGFADEVKNLATQTLATAGTVAVAATKIRSKKKAVDDTPIEEAAE
ncbi:hypothetical protein EWH08_08375 [Sphingobium indicum]|uniref:Uncharacterized protein n=1 Tax=Sphingobium indicum TaxID=332055 RepID=A0A4Q4JD44_9SPHN|nr:hypothetical protein [Sphingobium indicum]KEZ00376.1 hypothetical protein AI27_04455 [Sphingomonas sp. BHC-A]NYI23148.1 ElaB/YqjD/DUF883 family membrane-anchored ribosome-binding protein [Sphingobium indicum]RYM04453.1 hypothetical protein EWH08_08375 [Sphingobium indicum]